MIELITSNNDIEHPKNWLSERAEVVCIPTTKNKWDYPQLPHFNLKGLISTSHYRLV